MIRKCAEITKSQDAVLTSWLISFVVNPEQGLCHPLIQQHGQHRNHGTFHHIQRGHAEHDESGDIVDTAVDLSSHGDDGIQGQTVQLGEFWQQVDGIEGAAQNGHGNGAQNQTNDGAVFFPITSVIAF